MTASIEIIELLRGIVNKDYGLEYLAEWLAKHSLRFYESKNKIDSSIVAELDACLGEIQRGIYGCSHLIETTTEILASSEISVSHDTYKEESINSVLKMTTGTNNVGGLSMGVAIPEVVPSSS